MAIKKSSVFSTSEQEVGLKGTLAGAYQRSKDRASAGFPYVHWHKESFEQVVRSGRGEQSIAEINAETKNAYAQHAKDTAKLFAERSDSKTLAEGWAKMESTNELLNAVLKSNALKDSLESIDIINKAEFQTEVNGMKKSIHAYSAVKENRKALFNDIDALTHYVGLINKAIDVYVKMTPGEKEDLYVQAVTKNVAFDFDNETAKRARKKFFDNAQRTVGNKEGQPFQFFHDKRANTAMRNLLLISQNLNNYIAQKRGTAQTKGVKLPKISDATAEEWVRTLAGQFNGLKGGFFEVAFEKVFTDAMTQFQKYVEIENSTNSIQYSPSEGNPVTVKCYIDGKGASPAGTDTAEAEGLDRKVVSKSDVNVEVSFGKGGAKMVVGLSLKTNKFVPVKSKSNMMRTNTTLVGKANYKDLMTRAKLLDSRSNYDMLNILSHGYNGHTPSVQAMQERLAAMLAMEVVMGTKSVNDTAFFMVYTNKIVSVADFFKKLSEGKQSPLKITIADTEGLGRASFSDSEKRFREVEIKKGPNKGTTETRNNSGFGAYKKQFKTPAPGQSMEQLAIARNVAWVGELYRRVRVSVTSSPEYDVSDLVGF